MALFKYFSDLNGNTTQVHGLRNISNSEFAARWPGVKGIRADGYSKWAAIDVTNTGDVLPVTRMIEYKSQPSRHECNAKCLNGKHNGVCECKCGGKNHGAGMFTRILEAA